MDEKQFTAVFNGDISKFSGNPFHARTVFGRPFAIGIGNAFEASEEIIKAGEELCIAASDIHPTAPSSASIDRLHKAIDAWGDAVTRDGK